MAYPVGPPSELPMTTMIRATPRGTDVGLGVAGDEDPQDQDGGADGLSEAVPTVGADLGAGGEDAELEGGVAILVKVLLEGQPAQNGAGEGAEELGDNVDRNIGTGDGNVARQGDAGVEHVGETLAIVTAGFR